MSDPIRIGAADIVSLLANRHAGDVFVPECKDGPTHTAKHLRLDAWAMAKSWANPCFDGYEIKVSRSDWARDAKAHLYLPLCNRLWVVSPSGLLRKEEIPDSMGLMWAPSQGGRLVTKKMAPYREIDPPTGLLLYVLMCRAKIQREHQGQETREARAEIYAEYLRGKVEMKRVGRCLSEKLRAETAAKVSEAERRADLAEKKMLQAENVARQLEDAARLLDGLGVDYRRGAWGMQEAIAEALAGSKIRESISRLRADLDALELKLPARLAEVS